MTISQFLGMYSVPVKNMLVGPAKYLLLIALFTLSACQAQGIDLESRLLSEPVTPEGFQRAEEPVPIRLARGASHRDVLP